MSAWTWTEHLDQLEEWVRRAADPGALPPAADPAGVPSPTELLRARALLAAMADREIDLRRQRDEVKRADLYNQA